MTVIDPRAAVIAMDACVLGLDRRRCQAVERLLDRVREAEAGAAAAPARTGAQAGPRPGAVEARWAAALQVLAAAGRLAFTPLAGGAVEIAYTPSRAAILALLGKAGDAADGFPEPVRRKQAAALRVAHGALLRFPPEEGGPPLDVFITDWSPCPAAAAVAVHRDHPWVAGREKPAGPFFAGRYVRHPLTGDLLPVWVAEWVRPDFGTGAVLVNPAHDPVDLAFGRAVGLPIRFALAPDAGCDAPEGWLTPPLSRTGVAIRTGHYDGLAAHEAMAAYFAALAGRGLAERVKDVQAGQAILGRLVPEPGGELTWDTARRRLAVACDPAPSAAPGPSAAAFGPPARERMRIEPAPLLSAALAATAAPAPAAPPIIVCPAAEQSGALLFLRLLVHDLRGTPLIAGGVLLVQQAQGSKLDAAPEVIELGLLVGAPPAQVVVLKQQVLEQAGRFVRIHRELAAVPSNPPADACPGDGSDPPQRAVVRAREALLAAEPARAF
jgi:leucyl-tRNA synthetase